MQRTVADIVNSAFAGARERPSAPVDADRFLAFLVDPPVSGKGPPDTFAGRRRFVDFMHQVQLEAGMCFSNTEWQRAMSLSDFIALVEKKAANVSASRALALKRWDYTRRNWYGAPGLALVFLSPLAVFAVKAPQAWLKALFLTMYLGVALALGWWCWLDLVYHRNLVARIGRTNGVAQQ